MYNMYNTPVRLGTGPSTQPPKFHSTFLGTLFRKKINKSALRKNFFS